MAIEHERKLLLDTSRALDLLTYLKDNREKLDLEFWDITQGYLNNSCRIRCMMPHDSEKTEKYCFTFKQKVAGHVVEIEHDISIHDFQRLWLVAKPVIFKTRVKKHLADHHWDIDFLRSPKSGDIYIAIAEAEMPEFTHGLPAILPCLEPYAISWIPQGDKRFNNRNLANGKKTAKLLQEMEKVR
jgi:hypothetical protein